MPRPATLADYRWLYANGYMADGLKCARAIMLDIVERCPATFVDFGGGRGDLSGWIMSKTAGKCAYWDPAICGSPIIPRAHAEWVISCDVLEHIPRHEIEETLSAIKNMAERGLLLTIANMSDIHPINGEEVELHLIQEPMSWWTDLLHEMFPKAKIEGRAITAKEDRFAIIVEF